MTYQFTELQEKWLKALESGEYSQTTGVLYDGYGYCCLGLLCKIAGEEFHESIPNESDLENGEDREIVWRCDGEYHVPPSEIWRAANLHGATGMIRGAQIKEYGFLTNANDAGVTFAEIAAFIRANPEKVFLP